ncbi:hypothetical protein MN608_06647 [Microdochium nivale]|nr:hypothetical protein MN608_06647 [Microdochium nivale]
MASRFDSRRRRPVGPDSTRPPALAALAVFAPASSTDGPTSFRTDRPWHAGLPSGLAFPTWVCTRSWPVASHDQAAARGPGFGMETARLIVRNGRPGSAPLEAWHAPHHIISHALVVLLCPAGQEQQQEQQQQQQ